MKRRSFLDHILGVLSGAVGAAGLLKHSDANSQQNPPLGSSERSNVRSVFDMPSYNPAPDADNTRAVIDAAKSLGKSGRGLVRIPYGVIYDRSAVQESSDVPVEAVFEDQSLVNGGYPGANVIGYFDKGDPTASYDYSLMVSSGHNAAIVLDNSGLAGSASAKNKVAALYWTGGNMVKGALPKLRRNIGCVEFSLYGERWALAMRKLAPSAALAGTLPNGGYWRWKQGENVNTGEYCFHHFRFYKASSSGKTGSSPPTHTAGINSDGGIDWEYVDFNYDATVFRIDDLGRIGINSQPQPGTFMRLRQAPEDEQQYVITFEPTGKKKNITLNFLPTTLQGGVSATTPQVTITDGAIQFVSTSTRTVIAEASSVGFSIRQTSMPAIVSRDGDQTPRIDGVNTLILNNTSTTYLTNLLNGTSNQQVVLIAQNSNTTLVNSSTFVLQNASNIHLTPDSVIIMRKIPYAEKWIEVSRSIK